MTAEDALSILQRGEGHGYIAWDNDLCMPDIRSGTIVLDGEFSEHELLAILALLRCSREQAE